MTTPAGIFSGIRLTDGSVSDAKLQTISSAGKVANTATTATNTNTPSTIVARDGSGNFSAGMISLSGTPSNATDVATKGYVDSIGQGLRDFKDSARLATTAALPSSTYASGVLTATANGAIGNIDGVAPVVGDRILVKNQATATQNGLYSVTQVGDGTHPWILTRTSDADASAEVTSGLYVYIEEGSTMATSSWVLSTANPITLDTTSLTFTQFNGASQITASNGLSKSGNTLSVLAADSTINVTAGGIQVGSGSLTNTHIAAAAAIADTKLATISSAGKVANTATTATSANTANAIVARDASGNFTANLITIGTPTASTHAASKGYVDGKIAGTFVPSETPTGTIDGANKTFTLAHTPLAGTLKLRLTGIELKSGTAYTLSANTITYTDGYQPQSSDSEWHDCEYQY